MEIEYIYSLFEKYPQVTTDTRNCRTGSIFIALKGENFNGNTFVSQALEAGCAYAITDEAQYATSERILLVDNCLQTLQELAKYHRVKIGTPIIGITGPNGKTTTKELVAEVLSSQYRVLYTQGNLNNHIGVPLTLLNLRPEHEIAIIEMGASHQGEIKTLAGIAMPDYGLITNVGKAHLEGFGSFEGVIRTKGELYDFIKQSGGKIFIHHENPYLNDIAKNIDKIYYGRQPGSFVWGDAIDNTDSPLLNIEWHCKEGTFKIYSQLVGAYNIDNILAAIAIGKFLGITPENINQSITGYFPQNNRSQLKDTGKNILIIDTYNANPTSMMAALENFQALRMSPKAIILGDMKELGEDSLPEHQKIIDFIPKIHDSEVFLCGNIFSEVAKDCYPTFSRTEDLIEYFKHKNMEGHFILIKGSRSMKLEQVVEFL